MHPPPRGGGPLLFLVVNLVSSPATTGGFSSVSYSHVIFTFEGILAFFSWTTCINSSFVPVRFSGVSCVATSHFKRLFPFLFVASLSHHSDALPGWSPVAFNPPSATTVFFQSCSLRSFFLPRLDRPSLSGKATSMKGRPPPPPPNQTLVHQTDAASRLGLPSPQSFPLGGHPSGPLSTGTGAKKGSLSCLVPKVASNLLSSLISLCVFFSPQNGPRTFPTRENVKRGKVVSKKF